MAHFCPSNPCPICFPPKAKSPSFMEAGYVWAPYVPLVITPTTTIGVDYAVGSVDESLTKALTYPVRVLGRDGVKVGDLVKISRQEDSTLRKGVMTRYAKKMISEPAEPDVAGIYLGSEEFTPRGAILNSKICIRHVFQIGSEVIRIDEGDGRVVEILELVDDAE